ncbi:phosphatase PAP2 family protein [Vibrio rotiferianus]|uniref:phosphatase PAP2 family protein n=1 Tax=Vibrio rotiferianus TaxID=190895 RepID=UPI000B59D76A|nr:phosphatase PAP2 family protein [Vibrio rotiferianus]ASI95616.1 hypothetical protein BSZ04_11455 [Vibrio rotiferianus]
MEVGRTDAENGVVIQDIKNALSKDKLLFLFVTVSSIITYSIIVTYSDDIKVDYQFDIYLALIFSCLYATFLAWSIVFYFRSILKKESRLFHSYMCEIKMMFKPRSKAIIFFIRILIVNICFSNYTYLKQVIPNVNPFQHDELFSKIDFLLHGNNFPWEITHYIFSESIFTYIFTFSYHIWFVLVWGSIIYFLCVCRNEKYRQQYILSFLSCWFLLGSLLAIFLSSAGPCYIHLIEPDNMSYVALLDRIEDQTILLNNIPLYQGGVIEVQEYLWVNYINQRNDIGAGISAMPSMHVSSSVLLALGAGLISRSMGYCLWGYAIIIQIASVHLGWHYAIDGYFSFLATLVIWYSVRWLLLLKFSEST